MTPSPDEKWFHALRFPDGSETPGRFDADVPPNYTLLGALALLPHLDLAGADCMDIGTMDGLLAFALARAGAGRVVATDIAPRPTFARARAAWAPEIEYRTPFLISDMAEAETPSWDLIACCGVLYHVFDPLPMLVTLRRNLRLGGWLLLETQYLHREGRAHLSFAPSERTQSTIPANTFFRPSLSAVYGLVEVAGFEVVATIGVRGRLTVLARAERPSAIRTASPRVRRVLDRYRDYVNYREKIDHAALEATSAAAAVGYSGPTGDHVLYAGDYAPSTPMEPDWRPTSAGRLRMRKIDLLYHLRAALARRRLVPRWPSSLTTPR